MGPALARVDDVATRMLPQGVSGHFQGAAQAFQGSLGNLAVLLLIAVLVVYIVLGILYESYIHPLTILSGLPSAGFGALLTLMLFHIDLSIYAFVGMIMLIGIVEKNAIMQIDFALEAERSGMSPGDAIYKGCLIRFRPIMMTTMAALLRRRADRARLWRRRGSAPAPRPGRRRRPDLLAARHALPDARRLHLHGAVPDAGCAQGGRDARTGDGRQVGEPRAALESPAVSE